MSRPSLDAYFLELARLTATRSTCLRRAVGCVLVDEQGRVLSTGYNGAPRGFAHCNDVVDLPDLKAASVLRAKGEYVATIDDRVIQHYPNACVSARAASGAGLDGCRAVHAEQNALLQCPDVDAVHSCYVTTTPCVTCLKMLLNTNCQRIVATEYYARGTEHDTLLIEWWSKLGREVIVI